jgi:hypothetical protein
MPSDTHKPCQNTTMRLFFSDEGLEFTPGTRENILSCTPTSPSETFRRSVFPTPKMTLIREKTTLLFSEYSILSPIWLSKAESQLKMTANSTYWEAKLRGAGWVARSTGKEPLFSSPQSAGTASSSPVRASHPAISYSGPASV